jgi:hypothetical protein
MIETFIKIEGFENYEISNFGDVMHTDSGYVLCTYIDKGGYKNVTLKDNDSTRLYTKLVHRLVASAFIHNPINKPIVDHVDGNRINNCLHNLRWALVSENNYNRNVVAKENTSGYTGVNWHSYYKKWKARIKHQGKDIEIGLYDTIDEAIKARCVKAHQLFGDFANNADKSNYRLYYLTKY